MPDEDTTLFEIGEVVGGAYEIRSVLGEGGMGRVYGAHDLALNRRVALKASWPSIDPTMLGMEAQAIASVRHPGMIEVYGAGTHRGIPFLVMEFLYGVNLEAFLAKRRGDASMLGVAETLDLLIPVADALAAIHRSGIAHRDVKPANIMLTPNGRIVLMDFGLFQPESASDAVPCGTPEYMAPEALMGQVEPRSAFLVDVYALGMTAYELLTGEVPFPGATAQDTVRMQVRDEPEDVRKQRPDLSPRLAALVHEMIAKDPLLRPPSMEAVAFRLRAAREAANVPAPVQEKFTVLVVDDDAAIGKLLGMYATRAVPEAQIVVVDDAERALASLRERPPDVMLVDLHMPRMNGIELCMMLRGMHLADQCTIVAVSAGARDADIDLLRQLGITRFVPKGGQLGALLGPQIKELHGAWQRTVRTAASPSSSPASSKVAAAAAAVPLASASRMQASPPASARMPAAREIQASHGRDERDEAKARAFDVLAEMIDASVVLLDADGEPQAWNALAERTFGLARARDAGGAWTAPEGVTPRPLRDANGEVVGTLAIVRSTARK